LVFICVLACALLVLVVIASAEEANKKKTTKKHHGPAPHANAKKSKKHPAHTAKKHHAKKSGKLPAPKMKKLKHSGPFPGPRMEIAGEDETLFVNPDPNVRRGALAQVKALGATYIRATAAWMFTHPCRGQAALDYIHDLDNLVIDARHIGIKVQIMLSGVAANWGTPRGCDPKKYWKPTGASPSIKEYAAYIKQFTLRYAKLGVRRFSVWNEPNLPAFLHAGKYKPTANYSYINTGAVPVRANAKLYAKLWKTGYAVIQNLKKQKKISSSVKVLFGEFAGADLTFLKMVLSYGKVKADGFAYHPYQTCTPPETQKKEFLKGSTCRTASHGIAWAPNVQKALAMYAKKGMLTLASGPPNQPVPLYLTEFGYFQQCPQAFATLDACLKGIPESTRAQWYYRSMTVAAKNGARQLVLYQFQAPPPGIWNTALLDANLQPTDSYKAVKKWAQQHGYHTSK